MKRFIHRFASFFANRILFKIYFALALGFVFSSNPIHAQGTIKIMPLGNSISFGGQCTNGDIYSCVPVNPDDAPGYRRQLYNLLTADGFTIDFVGSQSSGSNYLSDTDNAGFGGYRDHEVADVLVNGITGYPAPYLNNFDPDIILLHIGTNDILAADTANINGVVDILNAIDSYETNSGNPVMVFLARTISTAGNPCGTSPRVQAYNTKIDALYASRLASGDLIELVDMECAASIDYSTDFIDQVHPTLAGYDKMGDAWYAAVSSYLSTLGTSYSLTTNTVGNGNIVRDPDQATYPDGTNVELTPDPDPGWTFTGWSGDAGGSAIPLNVTMDGDKSITASFTQDQYSLNITTVGSGTVSKSPDQSTYVYGDVVSLTPNPDPGWSFAGWSVDASGSDNPLSVTMDGNKNITATFTQDQYTLNVTANGTGSVSKNPDQATYTYGSTVDLTPNPGTGWEFDNWSGDATGSSEPLSVSMTGNKNIAANFSLKEYQLTLQTSGAPGASTSPTSPATVTHGQATSISVNVPTGYYFINWVPVSGTVSFNDANSASTTITMTSGDATIQANMGEYATLSTSVSGTGSITKNPDQTEFIPGSSVQLTATAGLGWSFDTWGGDASGSINPLDVTMDSDKSISATFTQDQYSLNITTVGNGSVSKSPDNPTYVYGTVVSLTPNPVPGWSFAGWSVDASGSDNPLDVTMDGNKNITATFTEDNYSLGLTTNGSGSVSKNPDQANYNYGDVVQLTANPATGWIFTGWGGDESGSDNPLDFTIEGDANIEANFTAIEYELNVQENGTGTISKSPDNSTYTYGETVDLTANPGSGWKFDNWTGDISTTDNPVSVLMNSDKSIFANFSQITYQLTLQSSGAPGADVSPTSPATVNQGEATPISATAPAGYYFINWTQETGTVSFDNANSASTNVTLSTGDATIQANFGEYFSLNTLTSGSGTVSKNPDLTQYETGASVELTASANPGWTFENWSGDASGSVNPLSVTMNSDKSITAVFSEDQYSLNVTASGTGTVTKSPDQATYTYGNTVDLTPNPGTGWQFDNWSGDATGSTEPLSVLMDGEKNITANFSLLSYQLTLGTTGAPGASVSPTSPQTVNHGEATPIDVTTIPAGYSFVNWTVDQGVATIGNSNLESTTVTLSDGNARILANFEQDEYSITEVVNGNGSISKNPDQTSYLSGTTVDLTASPDAGWVFDGWTGDVVSPATTITLTMNEDKNITANFSQESYTLTTSVTGNGSITRNPTGTTYLSFTNVELTPVAQTGWYFDSWSGDATGSTEPLSVLMDEDKSITANFLLNSYTLTVNTSGAPGATTSPGGDETVDHGISQAISVTSIPVGYSFVNWTVESGIAVIADPTLENTSVTCESDAVIQANFEQDIYTLTTNETGQGIVERDPPSLTYLSGTEVDLNASPDDGWNFDSWSGDIISTLNPVTIVMDQDKSITANFSIKTYNLTVQTDGTLDATTSPDGILEVDHGDLIPIAVTNIPEGYEFVNWTVESGLASATITDPLAESTTVELTAGDATVQANFELKTYIITATAGLNGTVSPEGDVTVSHGSDQTFTFTPAEGYEVDEILVDGVLQPDANELTITNVTANQSLNVSFKLKTYTITASAGLNGVITPTGDVEVEHGSDQLFTFTPDEGYEVDEILVDGTPVLPDVEFNFQNVTTDHTISVTFKLKKYIITSSTGLNGTITPLGETEVEHGSDQLYTFTPDEGYEVEDVLIDGISVGPLEEYTFTAVDQAHTISVSFVIQTFIIDATAGLNGVIDPEGETEVEYGSDQTFAFTPDEGYEVEDVFIDGVSVGPLEEYTFTNIQVDHTISVSFILKTYEITSIAGPNGIIEPSGITEVDHGTDQTFVITPDEGYEVDQVVIDGNLVENALEFTFTSVTQDHTISVTFIKKTYIVESVAGENGSITPAGETEVEHGTDLEFTIEPEEGYVIEDVLVNGLSVGTPASYTFTNITQDHIIEVVFEKFIEVISVSIPNDTMKINDEVTATLVVTTDAEIPYTLVSGAIGGYTLTNLQRVDNTTYTADFTVTEGGNSYAAGASIPVTNLVLSDGIVQSEVYQENIVQTNDLLDAARPVINFVWVEAGTKGVGDIVRLIISADATNYILDPSSSINGLPVSEPNIQFTEVGNGTYSLDYQVAEGNNDVAAGDLAASIVLVKPSGNVNLPYNTLSNANQLIIDANSPTVTTMEVPGGEYGIGDVVVVTITSDEEGYTAGSGTVINEVPLSSSRVSFTEVSNGVYTLSYTVAIGDKSVPTGELQVSVSLEDAAGNEGGPFTKLEPNSLSIYTVLPTATLLGTQTICEDDEATLTLYLTGRSPWSVYVSDGTNSVLYEEIYASPHYIDVSPDATATYRIDLVSDANGTLNSGSGSATVTVREKTDVEIINLKSTFSIESDPVSLEASVAGGTFSGPGVNSTEGIFDPAVADTVNSPHTIYYTYTNGFGCTSIDSALIFVLGAQGDVFVPRSFYCGYEDPFTVTGTNISEIIGSFKLLNSNGVEVAGLTDNGDNTAEINPGLLGDDIYTIEYSYLDQVLLYLREDFQVETIEEPEILEPAGDAFCQNEGLISLVSSVAGAEFSGPGVSGNITEGFVFNPADAFIGNNEILLTNTSMSGCTTTASKTLKVNHIPDLDFSVDRLCVSSKDTVFFTNTTMNKYIISDWYWEFDDPDSGEENTSTDEAPFHVFNEAGPRTITMVATSSSGCVDTIRRTIQFGDNPFGNITWSGECFVEDQEITLVSEMESSNPIEKYTWSITDTAGSTVTISGGRSIDYVFPELNTYQITVKASTSIGCEGTATREIFLKPVIRPTEEQAYFEDFNKSQVYWSADQSDSSEQNSWDFRVVNFENTDGDLSRGWYTDLPSSPVYEYSWVNSPCFDFSDIQRPMISLDIYRSMSKDDEGVVLQATTDGGATWTTVGEPGSGIGWYNSSQIVPGPGGQAAGWTGEEPFSADESWMDARHDLNALAGEENVQFRIAFASEHKSTEEAREGFGFDNVRIGSRTRKVLLEHFTNSSASDTRVIDGIVNNIYNVNYYDYIKLEYHTSFPGSDPFNSHNPSVPATRGLYYGITDVPYSLLNGGYMAEMQFDYKSDSLGLSDVKKYYLDEAEFDIEITTENLGDQLVANVTVTSLKDLDAEERIVHIVVYEKLVTGISTINGATNFLNVVKDMLPNVAGTAILDSWFEGQERSFQYTWDFANVFNPEMLSVAAFIQNDNTKEVYQAEANDSLNLTTSIDERRLMMPEVNVYPNPARDHLYVDIEFDRDRKFRIELFDQTGRMIHSDEMFSFDPVKQIELQSFNKGVYYLRIRDENGGVLASEKVVIMN